MGIGSSTELPEVGGGVFSGAEDEVAADIQSPSPFFSICAVGEAKLHQIDLGSGKRDSAKGRKVVDVLPLEGEGDLLSQAVPAVERAAHGEAEFAITTFGLDAVLGASDIGPGSGEPKKVVRLVEGNFPGKSVGAKIVKVMALRELIADEVVLPEGVAPVEAGRDPVFANNFRAEVVVSGVNSPRAFFLEAEEEITDSGSVTGSGEEGSLTEGIAAQPIEVALQCFGFDEVARLEMNAASDEFGVEPLGLLKPDFADATFDDFQGEHSCRDVLFGNDDIDDGEALGVVVGEGDFDEEGEAVPGEGLGKVAIKLVAELECGGNLARDDLSGLWGQVLTWRLDDEPETG